MGRKKNKGIDKPLMEYSEYRILQGMKKRCFNPKDAAFHNYGGRGITVCDRWLNDFFAFLSDVGPRPPDYTIERINNNGNYEPGNCKWISRADQAKNKRSYKNSKLFQYNGEMYTIDQLCKISGHKKSCLRDRLITYEWDVETALTTPTNSFMKKYKYKDKFLTLTEISRLTGVSRNLLKDRIQRYSWDVTKAVEASSQKRELYEYLGEHLTYKQLVAVAKSNGITETAIHNRIYDRKWPTEIAVTKPMGRKKGKQKKNSTPVNSSKG